VAFWAWCFGGISLVVLVIVLAIQQPQLLAGNLSTGSTAIADTVIRAPEKVAAFLDAFTVSAPQTEPSDSSTEPPPTALPDPSVRAWAVTMGPKLPGTARALDGLLQQNELVVRNPSLIDDKTWRAKTAAALALMQREGRAILEYSGEVPPELETVHQALAASGDDLVAIVADYGYGLDARSPRHMSNAVLRLRSAMTRIEQVNRQWTLFRRQYGL
jgi:hypothetical protein